MNDFLFITHDIHDPYFNLASEEYLLKEKSGYYIYLWINAPSVIVGTNQNTIQEVNIAYTEKNGIKIVRRLTGGGAVYHDLNNVCYTVIAPYDPNVNAYKEFTKPIIEYLSSLGVVAEFSGRNDILVDGKKISGNAQTVYGKRIMHHGTLLFKSDIQVLENALKPNKLKIDSKGIKSVKSRVANIIDCLKEKITINQFKDGLKNLFLRTSKQYFFDDEDIKRIDELVKTKYSTYEWNIGRSPKGNTTFEKKFDFGVFNLNFDLIDGKVENSKITGDFFSKQDITDFERKLNGKHFEIAELKTVFKDISSYIVNGNGDEIVEKLFE